MTDAPLTVALDTGRITGRRTHSARVFQGVRYADPPIGDNRWTLPRPATPWSGTADATKPGALCPQPGQSPELTDEDCLFVNVTTPLAEPREPLPVMVWLHGGGFTTGGGHPYDAQRLAEQGDVIVVTVNYRLGVFGYFGYEGLPGSGNFGLADQIEALRWVQRNAAAFGGDPGNVTVFGQSAGAMSIGALLASPDAEGLFHRAILQSGSPMLHWQRGVMFPRSPEHTPYLSASRVAETGAQLARKFNIGKEDALEKLRAIEANTLVEHTGDFANHVAWGTSLLPQHPADAVREGRVHPVPMISGNTRDEMRSFIAGAHSVNPITRERLPELMVNSFDDRASLVAEQYAPVGNDVAVMTWSTITTDASFAFAAHREHELLSDRVAVFAYEFADRTAPNVNGVEEVPGLPMGATHASDLPYFFDLYGHDMLTPEQRELSDVMIDYWTSFAHNGVPTAERGPAWQPFGDEQNVLGFDERGVEPIDFRRRHNVDFWAGMRA
ncbi:carboxylesterase/lipase family protein [Paramicrobacterium fandaimingii]|uniref:carboxylesterase/lipase family protein n=1 Tax=Paramicrobacterium fandaimingii TaxID=2708079 RepID=UPI00141FDB0D|nr:carboxylesterase family protein [Microbacterium fandaimingii]